MKSIYPGGGVFRTPVKDRAFLTLFAALSIMSIVGWLISLASITLKLIEFFVR